MTFTDQKRMKDLRKLIIQLFLVASLFTTSCAMHTDVSFKSPYSELIGKKYVLVEDLYIFKFSDSDVTYIGNNSVNYYLPKTVSLEFKNYRSPDVKIVGIIPRRVVFTIVACIEKSSPENRSFDYKAKFECPALIGQIIDVSLLTDATKSPPLFDDHFVKPN